MVKIAVNKQTNKSISGRFGDSETGKGMPSTLMRSCPLCRCQEGGTIGRLKFALFDECPLAEQFEIVYCQHCGFVFYNTPTDKENFTRYYNQNTAYFTNYRQPSDSELERHRHIAELIARHSSHKRKPVVDVGCNRGYLLQALQKANFSDPWGIDMLPECVTHVRSLGFSAVTGTAEKLPFEERKIGTFIFSHVFEHLLDPMTVLHRVHEQLVTGGLLYMEVPDAAQYRMGRFKDWYRTIFYEHVNHFDACHLDRLLVCGGFKPVETGVKDIDYNGVAAGFDNRVSCVYGLYRKVDGVGDLVKNRDDFTLAQSFSAAFASVDFDPEGTLRQAALSKRNVWIWGISQFMQLALVMTPLRDCNIRAYLDRDTWKQTQRIAGQPIQDPSLFAESHPEDIVVITPGPHVSQIRQSLDEYNFQGQIIVIGEDQR